MFLTRPSYAESMPPFKGLENCRAWGAIELTAALPWFMVEVQTKQKSGDTIDCSFLVVRMELIESLIGSFEEGDRVRGILAFYPPGFTQHHTWVCKEIDEIWEATFHPQEGTWPVWMLKTVEGEVLIDPMPVETLEDVSAEKLLYRKADSVNAQMGPAAKSPIKGKSRPQ
jgi:hypothetical protein